MAACEHVMEHLALACKVSAEDLRRSNMYAAGDSTHYGTRLGEGATGKWNVPGMWDRLQTELDLSSRRAKIDEFNAKNKWVKRGAALIPTKFGVAFTAKYMNQGRFHFEENIAMVDSKCPDISAFLQGERWSICIYDLL